MLTNAFKRDIGRIYYQNKNIMYMVIGRILKGGFVVE